MERALRIKGYRNIGFKDNKLSNERLVINNSLNKGELGDLIILIGPNNSGKSNVLDALYTFGNSQIKDRDVTDLFMEEDCRKPALTFFARNKEKEDEFAYKKEYKLEDSITLPEEKETEKELQFISAENFMDELYTVVQFQRNYVGKSGLSALYTNFDNTYADGMPEENLKENIEKVFSEIDSCRSELLRYSQLKNNAMIKEYLSFRNITNGDPRTTINEKYNAKYGYDFLPKIIRYTNEDISNSDLNTDYLNIEDSDFFNSVFTSIDVEISTLKNAYEQFQKQHNKAYLTQLEKKINTKLKTVAKRFNSLYYLEDTPYSFNLDLESDNIFFSLFRGEQAISLDYQSTGFKWFFNLFFNFLNSNKLNPGDIIIMDEPATNLHVKGQRELRGFLKDFAINNDINIIIATHSPFLIDMDYLDEIRVISNKDNISSIENNFAAVNLNDPDALLPIKESLTVENHILVNPEEKVIFVEGITDYNYLTAFKQFFGKTGITFLPINGIGKTKDQCIEITKRLMQIRKEDPILLVDNDKAGNCMKEVNKDNLDFVIMSLSDVDPKFKAIETLFSNDDLKKFNLIDSKGAFIKHASTSTLFKNQILKNKDKISEETKNNFEKLFNKIMEITE